MERQLAPWHHSSPSSALRAFLNQRLNTHRHSSTPWIPNLRRSGSRLCSHHLFHRSAQMFRAAPRFRSLARPSTLYRPLTTTAHLRRLAQPTKPARSHTVSFLPLPLFTPLRIASFVLYTSCLVGYVWYFFPEIEIEIQEGGEEEEEEEHEESDFADESSLFIPLTWTKKLPRSFYKGSDPEWQEFVKVSKDKARHKKIQCKHPLSRPSISHMLMSR
jgi:hypothetical protein